LTKQFVHGVVGCFWVPTLRALFHLLKQMQSKNIFLSYDMV
jgi:hypothetical protein